LIFATGFRPNVQFLERLPIADQQGRVLQRNGVADQVPGLFFVGLPKQRRFASATLRGVGADAGYLMPQLLRHLDQMPPEQLRALAAQALQLQSLVEAMSRKIQINETLIEQFKFEIALLKRHKFAKRSEQISPAQGSLLDDLLDTDLEAIEAELKQLLPASSQTEARQSPKRARLPPQFPRTVIITSRKASSAPLAANFTASAKTSARSWIKRHGPARHKHQRGGGGRRRALRAVLVVQGRMMDGMGSDEPGRIIVGRTLGCRC